MPARKTLDIEQRVLMYLRRIWWALIWILALMLGRSVGVWLGRS